MSEDLNLFYIADQKSLTLDKDESYHAVKVLRMKVGDDFWGINGRGEMYLCSIVKSHPAACEYIVKELVKKESENLSRMDIAIAPPKSRDRIEWFVEKAVELGVGQIFFVICEHSERDKLKLERLEKIVLGACKQSKSLWIPSLFLVKDFYTFVSEYKNKYGEKYLATCVDCAPRHQYDEAMIGKNNILMCIGPEGDFSDRELSLALEQGFNLVSLGDSRLRTETAAIYALASYKFKNHR